MTVFSSSLLFVVLVTINIFDLRAQRLPDLLTLPLLLFGLAYTIWYDTAALPLHAVAALLGFLALWLVATLYRRRRGFDGLGLGDAKLFAAGGAWLGPVFMAPVLLAATLLALTAVGILQLSGRQLDWQTRLPFGPFLSLAIFGAWCVKIST